MQSQFIIPDWYSVTFHKLLFGSQSYISFNKVSHANAVFIYHTERHIYI